MFARSLSLSHARLADGLHTVCCEGIDMHTRARTNALHVERVRWVDSRGNFSAAVFSPHPLPPCPRPSPLYFHPAKRPGTSLGRSTQHTLRGWMGRDAFSLATHTHTLSLSSSHLFCSHLSPTGPPSWRPARPAWPPGRHRHRCVCPPCAPCARSRPPPPPRRRPPPRSPSPPPPPWLPRPTPRSRSPRVTGSGSTRPCWMRVSVVCIVGRARACV